MKVIIEVQNSKWRVRGEGKQWVVECPNKGQENGYKGMYYYGQLEYAVMKLYELALRDSDEIAGFADVPEKCREVSSKLLKAVRKAVSE